MDDALKAREGHFDDVDIRGFESYNEEIFSRKTKISLFR